MGLTEEYIRVLQASAERDAEIGAVLTGLREDTAKLMAGQDGIVQEMKVANAIEKARQAAGSKWGDLVRDLLKSTAGGVALLVLVLVVARSCGVDVSTLLQAAQVPVPAVQLSPGEQYE